MENHSGKLSYKQNILVYKFSILMFLILLNTNLLRSLKDSIVPLKLGVETLSFVRIYFEFPILCILSILYSVCIKYVSQEKAFRWVIVFYIVLIILFNVFYNYDVTLQVEVSHLTRLEQSIYYWPYSLIYVLFDLWPVIAYINFYWELSNRVYTVDAAKVVYPRYAVIGQSNLLISGFIIIASTFLESVAICNEQLRANGVIIYLVVFCLMTIERLYSSLSNQVGIKSTLINSKKLFFLDIFQESFYKLMFFSIIFYYASICILEILCIHYLRLLFHTTSEFMLIYGLSMVSLGIITVSLSYVGRKLLQALDISMVISILPLFLLIFGSMAFVSMICQIDDKYSLFLFLFTFVLGRGIKYTLYDSAKEIVTIPFRNDIKRLGKISDMLGVGTGRFLAHLFPVILFTVFPYANYENISGILTVLFLIMVILFYVVSNRMCKAPQRLL